MTAAKKKQFLARMAAGRAAAAARKRPKRAPAKGSRKKATAVKKPHAAARKKKRNYRSPFAGQASKKTLQRLDNNRKIKEATEKLKAAFLAGTANTRPNPKKKARRNPDSMGPASAMYESFHGREPARIIEHSDNFDYRAELAELGKLLELRIKINGDRATLDGFGPCQVACDPDGHNIAFLGGAQTIDLDALGIESDKDLVELGELTYIKYFSKKGFHDFAPIDYTHHFGEVDGIRPILTYDTFNRKLFLIGGNYQVKPEGITN
jgi:hypothetical protein